MPSPSGFAFPACTVRSSCMGSMRSTGTTFVVSQAIVSPRAKPASTSDG